LNRDRNLNLAAL